MIEADWVTGAGFRAVVTRYKTAHRCGYVGVSKEHPLYRVRYNEPTEHLLPLPDDEPVGRRGIIPLLCWDKEKGVTPDIAFDVHGGVTYSGPLDGHILDSDLWWFGFDCAHAGDALRETDSVGEFRSVEYCFEECESLARQLVSRVKFPETHERTQ